MDRRRMPVLLRLVGRAWRYRWWMLIILLITMLTSVTVVAAPELIKYAVDTGFEITEVGGEDGELTRKVALGNMGTLMVVAAVLLVVAVVRGISSYAQTYLGEKISQAVAYDFRNDIFDHLQRLSYAYHDDYSPLRRPAGLPDAAVAPGPVPGGARAGGGRGVPRRPRRRTGA